MPETFWWDTLSNSVAGIVGGLIVASIAGFLVHRKTHFENTRADDYETYQGPAAKWYTAALVVTFVLLFVYFSTFHPVWLLSAVVVGIIAVFLTFRFFLTTIAWQLAEPTRKRFAEHEDAISEYLDKLRAAATSTPPQAQPPTGPAE